MNGDLAGDDGVLVDRIVDTLWSGYSMPIEDIVVVLESLRDATEPGPSFISNQAVARDGRDDLRQVIAVRWSDHRHSATRISCRTCLDEDPLPWRSHPDGVSILLYSPERCDKCGCHIANREIQ